jgi:uncharacterized membrane protein YoaK (UPF0700 family)
LTNSGPEVPTFTGTKGPPSRLPQPKPAFSHTPLDLVLLSMAAGGADAAGYLGLGKVFTANMTGNIVLLGIALSEGRTEETSRAVFAGAAFVIGTCGGGWLCSRITSKQTWEPQITVVTGTITSLLTGIMKAVNLVPTLHNEHPPHSSRMGLQGLVIVTYCTGAAVSGFLMLHARSWAGFFPRRL